MAKKQKEQTTTITLTMRQYNELEGVISNAHFGGYYYRLKEERPQDVKADALIKQINGDNSFLWRNF